MSESSCSPPPEAEVVTTGTAKLWIGEDGILRVICLPGSVHGLAQAKENCASIRHKHAKKIPALIDLRRISVVTREAREFFGSPDNNGISAAALLVQSPLSRVIGNFFTGLSKMAVQHRLFTSESEAIGWLRGFLE